MIKPTEIYEIILTRPALGTIARGPVMKAGGKRALGVLIGPVEAQKGDRIGLLAEGRQPQVWELESGFLLTGRKIRGGTFANGAVFDIPLDEAGYWSVERSEKMYSDRQIEYIHALNNPDVRIILG